MPFAEVHKDHITMEELKAMSAMDPEDLSPAELRTIKEISRKTDECPVCQARYLFYRDSQATLSALTPRAAQTGVRVSELLRAKASQLSDAVDEKDAEWQRKLVRWLESAQQMLSGAFAQQARLQPVMAGTLRGGGKSVTVMPAEGAVYSFTLTEQTCLELEIRPETPSGTPVCAVVCGRNGTEFSGVYPLRRLMPNRPVLLTEHIVLERGEYTVCIPTLKN